MGLGWLVILQSIPWNEVIKNAPRVAAAAKKLWNTVAKKSPQTETDVSGAGEKNSVSSGKGSLSALEARISELEANASDLNSQMLASSKLIRELADQNTQLIKRIERNRMLTILIAAAMILFAVIAVFNLYMALSPGSKAG